MDVRIDLQVSPERPGELVDAVRGRSLVEQMAAYCMGQLMQICVLDEHAQESHRPLGMLLRCEIFREEVAVLQRAAQVPHVPERQSDADADGVAVPVSKHRGVGLAHSTVSLAIYVGLPVAAMRHATGD